MSTVALVMYTWYIGTIDNDKVEDTMSRTITVTVLDVSTDDHDTVDEAIRDAIDSVGEFASGIDVEVDVAFNECVADAVVVDVTGADEDVALFSRRWFEE